MVSANGQGLKRRHLVHLAIFVIAWIAAAFTGLLVASALMASLTGIFLGAIIIPIVGYTREEVFDDLDIGFAHYDADKRILMGLRTTYMAMLFCIALIIAMPVLPSEDGRLFGAAAGGLMLPHFVNVLSKLRSIRREGVTP